LSFCEWRGAGETQQAIFVVIFSFKSNTFFNVLLASFAAHWMVMGTVNLSFVLVDNLLKHKILIASLFDTLHFGYEWVCHKAIILRKAMNQGFVDFDGLRVFEMLFIEPAQKIFLN
jgi:hypothetical protein